MASAPSTTRSWSLRGTFGAVALGLPLLVLAALGAALVIYPTEYVYRVLVCQESDALDWQKFPSYPLDPAPTAHRLAVAPDPAVSRLLGELAGTGDWDAFLAKHHTRCKGAEVRAACRLRAGSAMLPPCLSSSASCLPRSAAPFGAVTMWCSTTSCALTISAILHRSSAAQAARRYS